MARTFEKQPSWQWELRGIEQSPFASMGKAPLMAIFDHVARDGKGHIIPDLQCCYPNMRGYTDSDLLAIIKDPVGSYKHGISGYKDQLPSLTRLLQAASVFHEATDEELDAHMPKKVEVPVMATSAQALKFA